MNHYLVVIYQTYLQKIDNEYNIIDLLVDNKICSSKREARELVSGNSISINGNKINDLEYKINKNNAIDKEIVVIRRGKKKYYIGLYK